MNYIEGKGTEYDNLIAGVEIPVVINNVSVTGAIEKGCVLCGTGGVFTPVASTADTVKPFCIAADIYDATDTGVISAYFGGKFNANKIISGVALDTITEKLRTENIIITTAKEY